LNNLDTATTYTPPPVAEVVAPLESVAGTSNLSYYIAKSFGGGAFFHGGGLTSGPSIAGEGGSEWIVPTYEPQRSRFLESAPPQFWENLRGAGVMQPGGGGDVTVHVPVYLDGAVFADVVAKQIPRNANPSGSDWARVN
jgi:hypothetical protein